MQPAQSFLREYATDGPDQNPWAMGIDANDTFDTVLATFNLPDHCKLLRRDMTARTWKTIAEYPHYLLRRRQRLARRLGMPRHRPHGGWIGASLLHEQGGQLENREMGEGGVRPSEPPVAKLAGKGVPSGTASTIACHLGTEWKRPLLRERRCWRPPGSWCG